MKRLLIFCLTLFSAQLMYASSATIAQVACKGLNAPTVEAAVYIFDVGYPPIASSPVKEATLVIDPAALPSLLLAAESGAGYSCTLSDGSASLVLSSVTFSGVAFTALINGTYGFPFEQFATVTLAYQSLTPSGFSTLETQRSLPAHKAAISSTSTPPPVLICQPLLGSSLTIPLELITVAAAAEPPRPGVVVPTPVFGGEIITNVAELPQLLGSFAGHTTYPNCTVTGDFPTYTLTNVSFGFPTSVEVAAGLATQNSSVNITDSRTVQVLLNIGSIAPGAGAPISLTSRDTKQAKR